MEYASQETSPLIQQRRALWPGLLLGGLLLLFVGSFIYAAYILVDWGKQTAAQVPDMPPLALPQLVRSIPAQEFSDSLPVIALAQPAQRVRNEERPVVSDRVTVLLMGVDNRPGQTVSRTDSVMVITMNPADGTVGMFSLPRDLLVTVPGFGDVVKINMVHVLGEIRQYPGGGPQLLKETVEDTLGYPVDYFVRMNFDGFRQVIDLIGGVDIEVPREIRDDLYPDENYGYDPLYIPAGLQHMDGDLALKYARTRHIDSDYGRAGRQQQVLMAVRDRIMQPGQLAALLPRLPGLAIAMANTVQTDMPVEKAIALARVVGEIEQKDPQRVVIDNTIGVVSLDPELGYVLTPDMAKLRAAADSVFADQTVAGDGADVERQAITDEAARLVVLNGTMQEGLGAQTAADLGVQGFAVSAVGNAATADFADTVLISHGDTKPQTLEALIRLFGIAPENVRSEPPSEEQDLTLIVGSDVVEKMAAAP
jgi:LCP family protein required for cell wall assembly